MACFAFVSLHQYCLHKLYAAILVLVSAAVCAKLCRFILSKRLLGRLIKRICECAGFFFIIIIFYHLHVEGVGVRKTADSGGF